MLRSQKQSQCSSTLLFPFLFMVHNPPGGLDLTQFESPTSPTPELEAAITTVFHNERNYYDILVL